MQPAFVSYNGTYTTSEVTGTDGKKYMLYTFTKSGTLVLSGKGKIWMCGGGAGGRTAAKFTRADNTSATSAGSGWGGGGGYVTSGELEPGSWVITIGAAGAVDGNGGTSKIVGDAVTLTAAGGKKTGAGGSGGGVGAMYGATLGSAGRKPNDFVGTGDKASKYPFGITSLAAHCAGGSAGGYLEIAGNTIQSEVYKYTGGKGGSNGANGSNYGTTKTTNPSLSSNKLASGGASATKGGGVGGDGKNTSTTSGGVVRSATAGSAATFYGSGGGGGGCCSYTVEHTFAAGAKGYQGVAYLLDEIA